VIARHADTGIDAKGVDGDVTECDSDVMHDTTTAQGDVKSRSWETPLFPVNLVMLRRAATAAMSLAATGMAAGPIHFPAPGPVGR
jgi:hypothetical protein